MDPTHNIPSLSLSHYLLSCYRSTNLYRFCLFAAYRHSRWRCLPIGKHLCRPSPRPTPYTLMYKIMIRKY
ncbi:hypothetical protein HanRHA438_Chr09g0412811 [Helianthus annuus]|uniref:Uncharacterized protein n=1 Tax=Helianthus annuus TaxID=4232 RepID=A0A9K3I7N7_HELAN|nr:hypothetical protein HanXRQr2_Chr09g0400961 [Helianthus annuus]KAJ0526982.1 hypothetical protein HanHA300_Chr09g0329131 [Helianthus annuus]KAJ0535558.1 hypothetical protein HanIR_Chr09g0431911 [Helianthus annuus]KAJ0543376.1 hypothetical protein HanHA89_Chr09g0350021 [Helianthus annuus]KAJ0708434.1 hypothetical protein HanLR1_Chr09g0329371 [Helianthus annuus]